MLEIVIYVAILVIVLALVFWLLQQLPIPEPLNKFVIIAVVVIARDRGDRPAAAMLTGAARRCGCA